MENRHRQVIFISFRLNPRICAFGPKRVGPNILIDSTNLDFKKMYSSF